MVKGSDHLDLSFPGKNFSLELKSGTLSFGSKLLLMIRLIHLVFFLVVFGALKGKMPDLFQLMELDGSSLLGGFDVIVEQFDSPDHFILELHREVASLAVDKMIRSGPKWRLIGCSVRP